MDNSYRNLIIFFIALFLIVGAIFTSIYVVNILNTPAEVSEGGGGEV